MVSHDTLTMIMLCSRLGLDSNPDPKPLTLRSWNPLARKIQTSSLKRPGALLGLSTHDLSSELSLDPEAAERIALLLDRSGTIAIELERLESIGIYVMSRADQDYPTRFRNRLKESAPPILFYTGEKELLGQQGIAVVGSRHLDEVGKNCAEWIGNACGLSGMVLYSGGAKGVDSISMESSISVRGTAVGVMANNMVREIRKPDYRKAIQNGDLCLVTPYLPSASFNVGLAMGRNRLIYTLSDYGIVVASSAGKGGTWSGATENLKNDWVPLFVITYDGLPEGNQLLLEQGAIELSISDVKDFKNLDGILRGKAKNKSPKPIQGTLF